MNAAIRSPVDLIQIMRDLESSGFAAVSLDKDFENGNRNALNFIRLASIRLILRKLYPGHARTRKSLGEMTANNTASAASIWFSRFSYLLL